MLMANLCFSRCIVAVWSSVWYILPSAQLVLKLTDRLHDATNQGCRWSIITTLTANLQGWLCCTCYGAAAAAAAAAVAAAAAASLYYNVAAIVWGLHLTVWVNNICCNCCNSCCTAAHADPDNTANPTSSFSELLTSAATAAATTDASC